MILDTDYFLKHHKMIHYFGLGFIQVKIDEVTRYHFYTPELPAIVSQESIHNHRYNFRSKILYTESPFSQEFYTVISEYTDTPTHVLREESCKKGVETDAEDRLVQVCKASEHAYATGSEYTIDHNQFHRVSAKYAITCVTREPVLKNMRK